jgi:hypothetical protein
LGEALGLAGFTNLDVVRNSNIGQAPYVARLMWHQISPLGQSRESSCSAFSLFPPRTSAGSSSGSASSACQTSSTPIPTGPTATCSSTAEIGLLANGSRWHSRFDCAGFAFVCNGISRDHQQYLALGVLSFLLGNGRFNYGRENILETYYTLHAWREFHPSFGFQFVDHPGYERDRGPVFVPTLRLHMEF